jgi:peroxisomal membrane protein 2
VYPRWVNPDVLAYAVFGLVFGGPVPHAFYSMLDKALPAAGPGASTLAAGSRLVVRVLAERACLAPVMTALFLAATSFLRRWSLIDAKQTIGAEYLRVLISNWKFWTPAIIANLAFVPLQYRAVFAMIVSFVWSLYLALRK